MVGIDVFLSGEYHKCGFMQSDKALAGLPNRQVLVSGFI